MLRCIMLCYVTLGCYVMVWYGMVWYGMVWYGMVRYGMAWYGMVFSRAKHNKDYKDGSGSQFVKFDLVTCAL